MASIRTATRLHAYVNGIVRRQHLDLRDGADFKRRVFELLEQLERDDPSLIQRLETRLISSRLDGAEKFEGSEEQRILSQVVESALPDNSPRSRRPQVCSLGDLELVDEKQPDPALQVEREDTLSRFTVLLSQTIDELPELERKIVRRVSYGGESQAQVARDLGLAKSTVNDIFQRVVRSLRASCLSRGIS